MQIDNKTEIGPTNAAVTGAAAAVATATAAGAAKKWVIPKKFGGIEKRSGKTVPNSVRKKRVNFRLRKMIIPKAPLTVLNEMIGAVNYTFVDNPPQMVPQVHCHLFTAQCNVDGTLFKGTGPSKAIAKNICAEHAIQHVVSKRCVDPKNRMQVDEDGAPLKQHHKTDETPWAQLASLALFKLFNDWQAQGYDIPAELLKPPDQYNSQGSAAAPGSVSDGAAEEKQEPKEVKKKIPENATEKHPVQLLNELHGPISFTLIGESGSPPSVVFTMQVVLDGETFVGDGKNKKEAKRRCALEILAKKYSVIYPEESNVQQQEQPMSVDTAATTPAATTPTATTPTATASTSS